MEITSDYLTKNEDIGNLINKISDNTGERNMDTWIAHLRSNRKLFRRRGWAASALQGREQGKTAVICGSSPAIRNQIEKIKSLQFDEEFIICGLSSNLEYLLKNGIKPNYCIVVDADESTGRDWDRVDMGKTKGITLISNTYAYPPMLERWQGPLYFLELQTSDKRFERKKRKWYGPANGIHDLAGFPSIMAQFNVMAAASYLILECPILIFVGHELSFKDENSKYYVDREDLRDNEKRFAHGDIRGNKVHTTVGLLAVKYSLEGFLELLAKAGWFFNCTEAGIFGITKKFPDRHVPWITQLTLQNGISQAKQIMRTGQPFYE
jgi:hypothetical protein|tara:strand:- start:203 stop:1171 length:969 start_codon:yes stop_codon:yes gene_type:complete